MKQRNSAVVNNLAELNGTMTDDDRSGYYNLLKMYTTIAKERKLEHVMEPHRIGIIHSIERGNGMEAGYRIRQAAAALQQHDA